MSNHVQPLQGNESFTGQDFGVLDFWRWAYSDLLSNTLRGILAEFLVAKAVGATKSARREWDAFDVTTPSGVRIEVKSAAYVQSWHQDKPSNISFDIAPKKSWDAETNTTDVEPSRSADIYVFALLHEQNRDTVNPLDLNQWTFFVLPTATLNTLGNQKRLSLGPLRKLNPAETTFDGLAEAIHNKFSKNKK